MAEARTAFRTCPLCEATCGLELTISSNGAGERISHVRGDRDHVFSKGFICPKGAAFGELVEDPDRLRRPLLRGDSGFREVSWDEAFAAVNAGLQPLIAEHGNDAVAVYVGNPSVHTMAGGQFLAPLLRGLRSRNIYTAATVDQMPKHVACGHMFGDPLTMPVPDIDRTHFMLILGANPWESNGSLATAPDWRGRLKAIQARGGRFVVVDPRRTRTAAEADERIPIKPNGDAHLLMAIVNVLLEEDLARPGRLADHVDGIDRLRLLALDFPPERVTAVTGIPAERVRRLARELAAAPTAVVYGRVGTSTVEFGTLASWLVDVVNVLTGNFDRPGGAMFALPAHRRRRANPGGRGFTTGRWQSRVRGFPEIFGQLPVSVLAEEIDTPGEGRVRGLITFAGNPVLSTPNSGGRLERALEGLEFMVSVDPYLNETSRHANVILPPTDPARVGHYDFAFAELSVRNVASYSPPVLAPDPGVLDDSTILARLALIVAGQAGADPAEAGEALLRFQLARTIREVTSPAHGTDVEKALAMVTGDNLNERLLDVSLRTGAYGDGFGAVPEGLTLDRLKANPHGMDLGPLEARVPEIISTTSGKIELCPSAIAADVPRLAAHIEDAGVGLVLVGRRHLRSNNSWMHNVPMLMTGKERCTLQVHPTDAARLEVEDGGQAKVTSRAGSLVALIEVTDEVMPGVVSLPHGFGHGAAGTRMSVAAAHPGGNSNLLADDSVVDPLSGNAVLNGIRVEVVPVLS
jgi:anaerobic selenocysteine-containing dehydrogenase